jgi:hypothetical protein
MPSVRRHALARRLTVLVLAVLAVVGLGVALPVSSVNPGSVVSVAVADDGSGYDRGLRAGECALLGRAYDARLGCARDRCVEGAVAWRKVPGAEACALPGQPRGYGYAATVEARECRALHRRWIAAVNYCASEPDRSLTTVSAAPQCIPPASVYVVLAEQPGRDDECLTRDEARAFSRRDVVARQRATASTTSGPLIVGDSVTWRGGDELARTWPRLTVDGEPGRRPTELARRVEAFRSNHGWPTGLVVELGTNPTQHYLRRDLAAALRLLPPGTPVLLVLPYVEISSDPLVVSGWSQRFGGWMRSVAAGRPRTCVADWPTYVAGHPGLLQDGIHPQHAAEIDWARWISGSWGRCFPVQ